MQDQNKEGRHYIDLKDGKEEESNFFFLENILKARIALHCESGRHSADEEVNVYLAGLLQDMVCTGGGMASKPYISAYDQDVRRFLDEHPDNVTRYIVYKDNADFGLMQISMFLGYAHSGSYYHQVCASNDETGRIGLYYRMAGSAVEHITHTHAATARIFYSLSDHMTETVTIIRKVASDYFDLMERMSEGSLFHLGREIDGRMHKDRYRQMLDEFLKLYARYDEKSPDEMKQRLRDMVSELRALNPQFLFDDEKLK